MLSIVFGLLVSNLRLGYKATLYSRMYANIFDYELYLNYVDEESHKATSK